VVGAKPIDLMRALVRDYSRPGDVICDPCAGGGTTGRAAQLEGRGFIGAEMDPDTFAKAQERLARPFTAPLLIDTEEAEQGALL
jgi:site-specific DNA-methyltransferase (adenine-specific)